LFKRIFSLGPRVVNKLQAPRYLNRALTATTLLRSLLCIYFGWTVIVVLVNA